MTKYELIRNALNAIAAARRGIRTEANIVELLENATQNLDEDSEECKDFTVNDFMHLIGYALEEFENQVGDTAKLGKVANALYVLVSTLAEQRAGSSEAQQEWLEQYTT